MSNMSEQLKLMAIQQSADEISNTLGDLQGVKNALLAGPPEQQPWGNRLQDILKRMEQELTNIQYVTAQGRMPESQQELELGLTVQTALNEISQI
ncbi:hypothetical protein [Tumebacillus flagellatus]|uniref:Uncharacterized protein n=1 Tax=Tumebacillus flagellatus TaxID=1157490 RepID=A0A074LN47_9BACL|nr:hypothetical protein [Tumebacillus flagellatus]KEO81940.1 hypothetical protein EL26_18095 [Tumebacillus flagellatus]